MTKFLIPFFALLLLSPAFADRYYNTRSDGSNRFARPQIDEVDPDDLLDDDYDNYYGTSPSENRRSESFMTGDSNNKPKIETQPVVSTAPSSNTDTYGVTYDDDYDGNDYNDYDDEKAQREYQDEANKQSSDIGNGEINEQQRREIFGDDDDEISDEQTQTTQQSQEKVVTVQEERSQPVDNNVNDETDGYNDYDRYGYDGANSDEAPKDDQANEVSSDKRGPNDDEVISDDEIPSSDDFPSDEGEPSDDGFERENRDSANEREEEQENYSQVDENIQQQSEDQRDVVDDYQQKSDDDEGEEDVYQGDDVDDTQSQTKPVEEDIPAATDRQSDRDNDSNNSQAISDPVELSDSDYEEENYDDFPDEDISNSDEDQANFNSLKQDTDEGINPAFFDDQDSRDGQFAQASDELRDVTFEQTQTNDESFDARQGGSNMSNDNDESIDETDSQEQQSASDSIPQQSDIVEDEEDYDDDDDEPADEPVDETYYQGQHSAARNIDTDEDEEDDELIDRIDSQDESSSSDYTDYSTNGVDEVGSQEIPQPINDQPEFTAQDVNTVPQQDGAYSDESIDRDDQDQQPISDDAEDGPQDIDMMDRQETIYSDEPTDRNYQEPQAASDAFDYTPEDIDDINQQEPQDGDYSDEPVDGYYNDQPANDSYPTDNEPVEEADEEDESSDVTDYQNSQPTDNSNVGDKISDDSEDEEFEEFDDEPNFQDVSDNNRLIFTSPNENLETTDQANQQTAQGLNNSDQNETDQGQDDETDYQVSQSASDVRSDYIEPVQDMDVFDPNDETDFQDDQHRDVVGQEDNVVVQSFDQIATGLQPEDINEEDSSDVDTSNFSQFNANDETDFRSQNQEESSDQEEDSSDFVKQGYSDQAEQPAASDVRPVANDSTQDMVEDVIEDEEEETSDDQYYSNSMDQANSQDSEKAANVEQDFNNPLSDSEDVRAVDEIANNQASDKQTQDSSDENLNSYQTTTNTVDENSYEDYQNTFEETQTYSKRVFIDERSNSVENVTFNENNYYEASSIQTEQYEVPQVYQEEYYPASDLDRAEPSDESVQDQTESEFVPSFNSQDETPEIPVDSRHEDEIQPVFDTPIEAELDSLDAVNEPIEQSNDHVEEQEEEFVNQSVFEDASDQVVESEEEPNQRVDDEPLPVQDDRVERDDEEDVATEPIVDPIAEPVVYPIVESPFEEPIAEPIVEPISEPIADPIVEPPVDESVAESIVEVIVDPTTEPVEEPVVQVEEIESSQNDVVETPTANLRITDQPDIKVEVEVPPQDAPDYYTPEPINNRRILIEQNASNHNGYNAVYMNDKVDINTFARNDEYQYDILETLFIGVIAPVYKEIKTNYYLNLTTKVLVGLLLVYIASSIFKKIFLKVNTFPNLRLIPSRIKTVFSQKSKD